MKKVLFCLFCLVLFVACSSDDTAEAHYQRGRQLSSENRSADAMREFLLAADAGDAPQVSAKAVSELGHLSLNQHDLGQARLYFEQAWQQASALHDLPLMVLAQRDLGRCRRAGGDAAAALQCFARADSLLTAAGADTLRTYVYPEYISLLLGEGRGDAARRLVRLLPVDRRSGPSCLVAGKFYAEQGRYDSAQYYLRRCLETDNVSSRASAAMYLSEMAADGAEWERAYGYALECAALVDSTKLQMQRENANLVSSLSSQLEVERENSRLYRVLAAVIVAVILLVALLVIYVRERIARLQRQHEEQRQARVSRARNRQELLVEQFRNTPLCRHILMNESVSVAEWEEIVAFLDDHADGFTGKLVAFYPAIKPQELQACQLLKLEFTNQQIATILCKTQQAITNLRKRLYQKMFGKEGSADDLNQFLRLFPQE